MPDPIVRRVVDGPHTLTVTVRRDKRLRSSARWTLDQGTIQVRIPDHLPADQIDPILDQIITRVLKSRHRSRKLSDQDLEARARDINRKYFNGELHWHTIRWVSNMNKRLGSCSSGGTTDGDIRISDRIQGWPPYVIDYIIAHELAHRRFPDHSDEFWAFLSRYPLVERARGFVDGLAYGQDTSPDDLI